MNPSAPERSVISVLVKVIVFLLLLIGLTLGWILEIQKRVGIEERFQSILDQHAHLLAESERRYNTLLSDALELALNSNEVPAEHGLTGWIVTRDYLSTPSYRIIENNWEVAEPLVLDREKSTKAAFSKLFYRWLLTRFECSEFLPENYDEDLDEAIDEEFRQQLLFRMRLLGLKDAEGLE